MFVEKNESIGKECTYTLKKNDASVVKPKMSVLDKNYDKPLPYQTTTNLSRGQRSKILQYESIINDNKPKNIG
jgi:hypothetical protein